MSATTGPQLGDEDEARLLRAEARLIQMQRQLANMAARVLAERRRRAEAASEA